MGRVRKSPSMANKIEEGMAKEQKHPSDSSEQSEAESELLEKLNRKLNWSLANFTIAIKGKRTLQIDGFSLNDHAICEVYSHIGKLNGAQYQKVLTDALKLVYAEKLLEGEWIKVLLFADREAAHSFESGTWYADVINAFGIRVEIVELDISRHQAVINAQERQSISNVRSNRRDKRRNI